MIVGNSIITRKIPNILRPIIAPTISLMISPKGTNLLEIYLVYPPINIYRFRTNFGFPFVKSGLIANSNGYLAGSRTTGIELGRIDEALGFL